jgi:hypothetical protein
MVDDDGSNGKQASGSDVVHIATTTGSGKRQAWASMDHFKNILEEACPNQAYPIKHKLRDCGMMKNFMASGSLTRGMELDKIPDKGDATPFPGEDAVMMVYNGRPPLGDVSRV